MDIIRKLIFPVAVAAVVSLGLVVTYAGIELSASDISPEEYPLVIQASDDHPSEEHPSKDEDSDQPPSDNEDSGEHPPEDDDSGEHPSEEDSSEEDES